MNITLQAIESGTASIDDLRRFVIARNRVDEHRLPAEEGEALYLARSILLEADPGSSAAALAEKLADCIEIVPYVTASGARIREITRRRSPFLRSDGSSSCLSYLDVEYDDGVVISLWCEFGDYGVSLATDAFGKAAFLTSMSSDGYYMVTRIMSKNEIGFLPRVNELADNRLTLLYGDVDPAAIAADPIYRSGGSGTWNGPVGTAPAAPQRPNLAKLYAAPPSPKGRAPLGRR